jgi:hypothetical protein
MNIAEGQNETAEFEEDKYENLSNYFLDKMEYLLPNEEDQGKSILTEKGHLGKLGRDISESTYQELLASVNYDYGEALKLIKSSELKLVSNDTDSRDSELLKLVRSVKGKIIYNAYFHAALSIYPEDFDGKENVFNYLKRKNLNKDLKGGDIYWEATLEKRERLLSAIEERSLQISRQNQEIVIQDLEHNKDSDRRTGSLILKRLQEITNRIISGHPRLVYGALAASSVIAIVASLGISSDMKRRNNISIDNSGTKYSYKIDNNSSPYDSGLLLEAKSRPKNNVKDKPPTKQIESPIEQQSPTANESKQVLSKQAVPFADIEYEENVNEIVHNGDDGLQDNTVIKTEVTVEEDTKADENVITEPAEINTHITTLITEGQNKLGTENRDEIEEVFSKATTTIKNLEYESIKDAEIVFSDNYKEHNLDKTKLEWGEPKEIILHWDGNPSTNISDWRTSVTYNGLNRLVTDPRTGEKVQLSSQFAVGVDGVLQMMPMRTSTVPISHTSFGYYNYEINIEMAGAHFKVNSDGTTNVPIEELDATVDLITRLLKHYKLPLSSLVGHFQRDTIVIDGKTVDRGKPDPGKDFLEFIREKVSLKLQLDDENLVKQALLVRPKEEESDIDSGAENELVVANSNIAGLADATATDQEAADQDEILNTENLTDIEKLQIDETKISDELKVADTDTEQPKEDIVNTTVSTISTINAEPQPMDVAGDKLNERYNKRILARGKITTHSRNLYNLEIYNRFGIVLPGFQPQKSSPMINANILKPELEDMIQQYAAISVFPGDFSQNYRTLLENIYKDGLSRGLSEEDMRNEFIKHTWELNDYFKSEVMGKTVMLKDLKSGIEIPVVITGALQAVHAAEHMGFLNENKQVATDFVADIHPGILNRFGIDYTDGIFTYTASGEKVTRPQFEILTISNK